MHRHSKEEEVVRTAAAFLAGLINGDKRTGAAILAAGAAPLTISCAWQHIALPRPACLFSRLLRLLVCTSNPEDCGGEGELLKLGSAILQAYPSYPRHRGVP